MENIWKRHEDWVEQNIINSDEKYIWISKNPQSGFTTSLGKVCLKKGLKFLEIAPYNKIIDDTIADKVMDKKPYGKISSNKEMCKSYFQNPYFKDTNGDKGIYHCNCKGCSVIHTDECMYYKVSHTDYSVYGTTYAKLDNILRHHSRMGDCYDDIINTIFDKTNIILLDEFANLISWLPKGFWVNDLIGIVMEINKRIPLMKDLDKNSNEIIEVLNKFVVNIGKTELNQERNGIKCGIYVNEPLKFFGSEDITITSIGVLGEKVIKNIVNTTFKAFKVEYDEDTIRCVRDALLCMLENEIFVYEKEDSNGIIKKYALSNMIHPFEILKPKLEEYKGKVVATGMVLPPFETLPWKKISMPDFNESEKQHLILCDTKNMWFNRSWIREKCVKDGKCTLNDWRREADIVKNFLLQLKNRFKTDGIIVFCFNKDIYEELDKWRNITLNEYPELKDVIMNKEFCLTYYGSEYNSGTTFPQRIKIYIGAAQTPLDAFEDAKLLYNLPHDKMRDMDIANRLVNALGRGKDPEGKHPSISIIIGCRMNDTIKENGKITKGLTNLMEGTNYYKKKEIITTITEGTIYCICPTIGYWWFDCQSDIKDIQTLPWFIDGIRIATIKYSNHKGFITLYTQIYDHWKQKADFNGGVIDVRNIMWLNYKLISEKFAKMENNGIKITGSKVKHFIEDLKLCRKHENK